MRILLITCSVLVVLGAALLLLDQPSETAEQVEPEQVVVVDSTPPVNVVTEQPTVPEDDQQPQVQPDPEEPAEKAKPSLIERIDDRSVRLDNRFTLRGGGTERDPYAITWDLLSSARSELDPVQGKTDVPPYIALLDGTWVRISGFYSSPLLAQEEVEEVLISLDSWDGCCIGLPPTPFDCLEVMLRKPVSMRGKHLIRFGTVTGRIKIEPFVVGNWLMGLYRLEDATLDIGTY